MVRTFQNMSMDTWTRGYTLSFRCVDTGTAPDSRLCRHFDGWLKIDVSIVTTFFSLFFKNMLFLICTIYKYYYKTERRVFKNK
jgi:hypothetical protein